MNLGQIEKSPEDVLDYDVDFSRWLPSDDRIDSAMATIDAGDAAIDSTDVSEDRVKVWISGGADGDSGTVTIIATTEQGRTKEACLRLRVKGC